MKKGWELMRICREYIETNGRKWEDEEKMRRSHREEEEKKMERLREAARKKGKILEENMQRS